jgi:hypothetical protein
MSEDQTTEVDEAPEADAPNLADLSFEELSAIEDELIAEFESRSQTAEFSEDSMQELRDVVEALETVREEAANRAEFAAMQELVKATSVQDFAVAEAEAEAPAVEEEAPEEEAPAVEAVEDVESVEDETPPATEEAPPAEEEFTVAEEVEAEISPDGLASDSVPATPKRSMGITASADVPGYAAGQELGSLLDVAEALMAKRTHVRGTDKGNDGYQYLVASIPTAEYDEAHTLGNDAIVNMAKIEEADTALVAGGGIKAPLTPFYELTVFGDSVRPVRDSLVGYKAERGGIRYVPSPVIGTLSAGVNVYAESVDASATPYGSGKGSVTVSAGPETTVKVDVIPRIMKVGNLMARTFPEMVSSWTKLLLAQHAREAETNLLDKLVADSTAISGDAVYGAALTILGHIDQVVAAYRSRHRIATSVRFRVILPFWVKDVVRTDISRKQFGGVPNLPDSAIEEYFSVRGINVTWHYDESSTTSSIYGAQSAGAMLKYKTTVEWFIFPEGTWLFLDGGSLDLGLVRDSTLNSTNDYTIFAETFESAARVGQQSLVVNSTVQANGSTSGPNTIAY